MQNSITGTINKFMLAGGEDNDWSVALKGDIDTTDFEYQRAARPTAAGPRVIVTGQFHGAAGLTIRPGAVTVRRIQRQLQQRLGRPAASGRASSRTGRQVRVPVR